MSGNKSQEIGVEMFLYIIYKRKSSTKGKWVSSTGAQEEEQGSKGRSLRIPAFTSQSE